MIQSFYSEFIITIKTHMHKYPLCTCETKGMEFIMNNHYVIRGKKLVTVSQTGTIENGALVVQNGKISDVGKWQDMKRNYAHLPILDYRDFVITPSLVDCHTHLLEFAPTSLYPVTRETHFMAAKGILFQALVSGITALGEQICGHPNLDFSIDDYREMVRDLPIDISFAGTNISIGFEELTHFTSITKSRPVAREELLDPRIIINMAKQSDYPGEHIFINATPANFTPNQVPRAGELVYSLDEIKQFVTVFHHYHKQIGAHVGGEMEIKLAIDAGIDVLHHAHGISDELISEAFKKGVKIIATPLGGTHLKPNSPEDILKLVKHNVHVSIGTDSYLPPHEEAKWLPFENQTLRGPEAFMLLAQPAMQFLKKHGYNENEILALITRNPAEILQKGNRFGSLAPGMEAHFLVAEGIPGLEITDINAIKQVYFNGNKVIDRLMS